MERIKTRVVILTALTALFVAPGLLAASERRLVVVWPKGWELQQPRLLNAAWYMQARQRSGGEVAQSLRLALVPTNKDISRESLHDLVQSLAHRASERETTPRALRLGEVGYYFTSTQSNGPVAQTQVAEGALFLDRHLIYFVLTTNTSNSPHRDALLAALASARID